MMISAFRNSPFHRHLPLSFLVRKTRLTHLSTLNRAQILISDSHCNKFTPQATRNHFRVFSSSTAPGIESSATTALSSSIPSPPPLSSSQLEPQPQSQPQPQITIRTPKSLPSLPPVTVNTHFHPLLSHLLKFPKKLRFLISSKNESAWTITNLKEMITTRNPLFFFYPARLKYQYSENYPIEYFLLESDEQYYELLKTAQKEKKTLLLYVDTIPNATIPIEFQERLQTYQAEEEDIACLPPVMNPKGKTGKVSLPVDPSDAVSYTMVSFFSFMKLKDPMTVREELFNLWSPMKALGRIYVAHEGINAQMAIPSNIFPFFVQQTQSLLPYFQESQFNTDPDVPKKEFLDLKPFKNLHIRFRKQIVADGLLENEGDGGSEEENELSVDNNHDDLNWKKAGNELTPLQWHEALSREGKNITLLDCRNTFESDVGIFQYAVPLNTTFFRESWKALDEVLANIPKNQPVYTYCTGGIRCVKINAYLEQKLGYQNTFRLKGGIIAYRRELDRLKKQKEQDSSETKPIEDLKSRFLGVNYVFDDRIGARITEDVLTYCEFCGDQFDNFHNCPQCNARIIQCPKCAAKYNLFCSKVCEVESELKTQNPLFRSILNLEKPTNFDVLKKTNPDFNLLQHQRNLQRKIPSNTESTASKKAENLRSSSNPDSSHALIQENGWMEAILAYSEKMSEKEPAFLENLRKQSQGKFPGVSQRMLSGPTQGAFLSFLATVTNSKFILELGTFTGYSAVCLAMNSADFTNKENVEQVGSGRQVFTCENDAATYNFAREMIETTPYKENIQQFAQNAVDLIRQLQSEGRKFDLVFIDADKREYLNYLQMLLSEEQPEKCLLSQNALILLDNTLWKGLVLREVKELESFAPSSLMYGGSSQRYELIAKKVHELNEFLLNHPRLRSLLLPIRDGFTILQYIPPNSKDPSSPQ